MLFLSRGSLLTVSPTPTAVYFFSKLLFLSLPLHILRPNQSQESPSSTRLFIFCLCLPKVCDSRKGKVRRESKREQKKLYTLCSFLLFLSAVCRYSDVVCVCVFFYFFFIPCVSYHTQSIISPQHFMYIHSKLILSARFFSFFCRSFLVGTFIRSLFLRVAYVHVRFNFCFYFFLSFFVQQLLRVRFFVCVQFFLFLSWILSAFFFSFIWVRFGVSVCTCLGLSIHHKCIFPL